MAPSSLSTASVDTLSPSVDRPSRPAIRAAHTRHRAPSAGPRDRIHRTQTSWRDLPPPEPDDLSRAEATVPRGAHSGDDTREPGVDLDVWLLHVQLQRTGAPAVLAALVEEYQRYAWSIAHRMVRHGEALEDIEQVAMEALVSSLHRFDVERSLPFPAFARPTISGAIKRHYRDRGWSVRTPRSVHDLAGPLRDAEERLTAEWGRRPTRAEVAEAVGVPLAAVDRADRAIRSRDAVSLDQTGPDGGPSRLDSLGTDDPDLDLVDSRVDVGDALEDLSDRERSLLALYFVDEVSQREIGVRYGVSQMQVSRWLASCVARLRGRVAEVAV